MKYKGRGGRKGNTVKKPLKTNDGTITKEI